MKPKIIALTLSAVTALAVVSALAINRASAPQTPSTRQERTFEVTGKVVAIELESKTIRIAHEEIPDYMPAMTMAFTVEKASLLNGLRAGDQVQFQLVVNEQDSWIAKLRTLELGNASAAASNAKAVNEPIRALAHVQLGEKLPDLALVDQNGRTVRLSSFQGQAVLLTFIYTRCPLPNFCPLMSKNFSALQQRLSKSAPGRFQLLSVSH